MTLAYVLASSGVGDSPGHVRVGLERLRELGSLVTNSDLYRQESATPDGDPPSYHVAALVETELESVALARALRSIEERYGSERGTAGVVHALRLDLALSSAGSDARAQVTLHDPAVREQACMLLPLTAIAPNLRIPPDGSTAQELAGRLAAGSPAAVTAVWGTAHLKRQRDLDYDAIGDAQENYQALRPLSRFDIALFDDVARAIGLRPAMRVLDVGCGTGRFSVLLAQAGASVIGVDRSANMLAAARTTPALSRGDVSYEQADANRALPRGPYDAATLFFSIQYLVLDPFLRRLRGVLAPGGAVAIATFPHRHFIETEHARFFPSIPHIDMSRFPNIPALTQTLRELGFEQVTSQDVIADEASSPDELIARTQRRYLSTFHLLSQAEFETGLAAMRAAYQGVTSVRRTIRAVVVSARTPR